MLTPSYGNVLRNVVFISTRLVLLQTLRAGYRMELDCDNKQEIKNFRSGALLSVIRATLEELEPYMEFLVLCEDGRIDIPTDQLPHILDLIKDLSDFYGWATEEVKLKNQRMALIELESKWKEENMD